MFPQKPSEHGILITNISNTIINNTNIGVNIKHNIDYLIIN